MTYEDFVRISTIIRDEMAKVDADVMDYQKVGKVVATLAMFQLVEMGADDDDIKDALALYTDSMCTELQDSWSRIKKNCIIEPN